MILISFRRLNIARVTIRKSNEKLIEANKIKDEYIADFFNQNSEYIEKIENLQKWFNRMVVTKQFEALRKFPEYINIQNERDVLYERFDRMFLKLFPNFVEEFRGKIPSYMLRHKIKTGMTGWAQVNGFRGNTSLEKRIEHDLYYIQHWSVGFDLRILFMTLWKGFFSRSAY